MLSTELVAFFIHVGYFTNQKLRDNPKDVPAGVVFGYMALRLLEIVDKGIYRPKL